MDEAPVSLEVMIAYRELMRELKIRIDFIDKVYRAETGPLPLLLAEETCYLQLRMVCELIASGCLLMHGNLKPKAALLTTHKADWVMTELAKLHPEFYPDPLKREDELEADGTSKWVSKESGFLTKEELRQLWNRECGTRLHRGGAENVLKERTVDMRGMMDWRRKIVQLLERHTISTPDEEWVTYCSMNSKPHDGDVFCRLYRRLRN